MKRNLLGALAASALLCAGLAFAHDKDNHQIGVNQQPSSPTQSNGYGGSGSSDVNKSSDYNKSSDVDRDRDRDRDYDKSSDAKKSSDYDKDKNSSDTYGSNDQSGQSLKGEIVKYSGNMLFLRHMGAVVPIKIDKQTSIDDKSLLKEGQMAMVDVKIVNKTQNLATRISSSESGTGGSGINSGSNDMGQSGSTFHDYDKDRGGTGGSGDLNTPAIPERSPGAPLPEEPNSPRAPSNPNDQQ